MVFVLVIRQMMGTRHVQNKTQVEKVKAGLKATAVILPLLGITWLFGLLSFSSSTVAFKYMFAIFNSLQGFMIFIFHCLLNKQVKSLNCSNNRVAINVVHMHLKKSTGQLSFYLNPSLIKRINFHWIFYLSSGWSYM